MADILPPAPIGIPFGSYGWDDWYRKVRDAINNAQTVSWASITGTPTTLSGYGITDALSGTDGTYTPTLTGVTNVAASTAYACQYVRGRNTVTVSGRLDIDPTAAGSTVLGISLPVASNFSAVEQCAGVAFASGIAGMGAAIRADTTNDRAELVYVAVDTTNQPIYFHFTYRVI